MSTTDIATSRLEPLSSLGRHICCTLLADLRNSGIQFIGIYWNMICFITCLDLLGVSKAIKGQWHDIIWVVQTPLCHFPLFLSSNSNLVGQIYKSLKKINLLPNLPVSFVCLWLTSILLSLLGLKHVVFVTHLSINI